MRYLVLLITFFSSITLADGVNIYKKAFTSVALIGTEEAVGSGAIITKSGYVLTNYHVVEGYSEVDVYVANADSLEESKHKAEVVKIAPSKDLALLRIYQPKVALEPINISLVVPEIGEEAHAIGHPDGELWTYTKGYVSQMNSEYEWSYDKGYPMTVSVYQVQTPTGPGFSGGPLLNKFGNLIGINSFGHGDYQYINYALSVEEIIKFITR